MSRRACSGSGKFSHTQLIPCFLVSSSWSCPYQLLWRIWVHPFPGQMIMVGDADAAFIVAKVNAGRPGETLKR